MNDLEPESPEWVAHHLGGMVESVGGSALGYFRVMAQHPMDCQCKTDDMS